MDWTDRHSLKSGLGVTIVDLNIWNPAEQISTDQENTLVYTSVFWGVSTDGRTELIFPINWCIKEAIMSTKTYSLVISCATSSRGDYLTGCSTNELYVDDFQWVY